MKRKIVFMMSVLVTITPTLLVALLAFTYYQLGIESLFNERISKSVSQTVEVAESYLREHKNNIKGDVLAIANGIDMNHHTLVTNPELFTTFLSKQAEFRNLSEVMVFQPHRVVARNGFSFSLAFEKLPEAELKKAKPGEIVLLDNDGDDRVRALIKLNNFVQTYLLVGRYVDRDIINHLHTTQGSADQYQTLITDIKGTQKKLEVAFVALSLLLCTIAILIGMRLARVISKPINQLVDATAQVKDGDFSVRVPEKEGKDETAVLAKAFNQMTETLSKQRDELVKANNVIDERRRFIEAVLSEISAGVIAISPQGIITLYNNSAAKLLHIEDKELVTLKYTQAFKELKSLLEQSKENPTEIIQDQMVIVRNNQKIHLFVRIGAELTKDGKVESFIVTFDDITNLVGAQRSAAWADVARRVAHEIKNPLTPINLSAERLKKKYHKEIKSDPDTFGKYVDTIIRHVTDIGKIVEEFVDFGRIPSPKLKKNNIVKLIKDTVFSQECAFKFVTYEFDAKQKACNVLCDSTQITQVMINLLKNAAESIEAKSTTESYDGLVSIDLKKRDNSIEITITENGQGFDADMIDRIAEPYVTTKTKGTGLGLPIVKKIIEDHGGTLSISNIDKGACVKFNLQLYKEEK